MQQLAGMNLKEIMLSEKQPILKGYILHDSFMYNLWNKLITDLENRLAVGGEGVL